MQNPFLSSCVCWLPVLLATHNALAQTPAAAEEATMLDDIPSVFTASKYEQPVTQAPASVSVVTADDIKKFGYRHLADILTSLKGMYGSYDRAYQRIGIRGFNRPGDYNYRLLVLIDGHRANDNIVDYNATGSEFLIDVDDISRVELVRGPASSLYGSNAFFGVVNIITKQGRDLKGAALQGTGGSQQTFKGKFSYGNKWDNGAEVYLSGSHYQSNGNDRLPVTGFGTAVDVDKDHAQRGFAKWSFADFTLSGGYVSRDKSLPVPSASAVFNDSRNRFIDSHAYANLQYRHYFDNGLDVTARLFYDHIGFDGAYVPALGNLYQDVFHGQWWGQELTLRRRFGAHHLTLGGEYRDNFQQQMHSFDRSPYHEHSNIRQNGQVIGAYVQDEFQISDDLTLNAGARYDQYPKQKPVFNPRVALIYQTSKDSTLKLLYGQAFRAPSVFDQYYRFSETWAVSHTLQPETLHSYELNFSQRLTPQIEWTVSPFYNQVNDLITLTGSGQAGDPFRNQNTCGVDTYGFELETTGNWDGGWRAAASYSYQQSQFQQHQHQHLPNSPVHLTKLNLVAPLWRENVFAGANLSYTSRRGTANGEMLPGYFLANLTLFSTQLIKGLELSGSVYNLFNWQYQDPSTSDLLSNTIMQDGRLFLGRFTYEF